ncbi:MAG: Rieske 2Fe-2S domain-containing protein [Aeromicrobium sp.]|uniref:cytochrome bc1 complex Rieske iron-sulfur subunit n=1 Tax=Aeromicrobium sp. TaxID=1871063 RepID=UPI0039E40EE5
MSQEVEHQTEGDVAEPIADPGLPEHHYRVTDVDEAQSRRTERQISAMFVIASLLAVGFFVAYFTVEFDTTFLGWSAQNVALGGTLGGSLLLIGLGIIQWAKKIMSDHEMIELRHPAKSSDDDREAVLADLNAGIQESQIARRPLLRNTLLGSLAALALPGAALLWDLGPVPYGHSQTVWRKGMRVVNDVSGLPMKPSDLEVGQLVNAEPAAFFPGPDGEEAEVHGHDLLAAKAKAAVIVVRMRPEDITPEKGKENWGVDGILCYSKICTHVGCPISLWEQQTHHLLCPCHQSTFDLADNGKAVFGPAYRPLPQLPLKIDSEGYLVAQSDFPDIVTPSYPEIAQDQKDLDEKNGRNK